MCLKYGVNQTKESIQDYTASFKLIIQHWQDLELDSFCGIGRHDNKCSHTEEKILKELDGHFKVNS